MESEERDIWFIDTSNKQSVGNVTMYCVDQRLKLESGI